MSAGSGDACAMVVVRSLKELPFKIMLLRAYDA